MGALSPILSRGCCLSLLTPHWQLEDGGRRRKECDIEFVDLMLNFLFPDSFQQISLLALEGRARTPPEQQLR